MSIDYITSRSIYGHLRATSRLRSRVFYSDRECIKTEVPTETDRTPAPLDIAIPNMVTSAGQCSPNANTQPEIDPRQTFSCSQFVFPIIQYISLDLITLRTTAERLSLSSWINVAAHDEAILSEMQKHPGERVSSCPSKNARKRAIEERRGETQEIRNEMVSASALEPWSRKYCRIGL